jgi:hypothetical protein
LRLSPRRWPHSAVTGQSRLQAAWRPGPTAPRWPMHARGPGPAPPPCPHAPRVGVEGLELDEGALQGGLVMRLECHQHRKLKGVACGGGGRVVGEGGRAGRRAGRRAGDGQGCGVSAGDAGAWEATRCRTTQRGRGVLAHACHWLQEGRGAQHLSARCAPSAGRRPAAHGPPPMPPAPVSPLTRKLQLLLCRGAGLAAGRHRWQLHELHLSRVRWGGAGRV